MPQSRKTKQQKIQISQRKAKPIESNPVDALAISETKTDLPSGINQEIADTQRYVIDELKRIGWITVVCAVILTVATLLLSDFSWAQSFRKLLSL